MEKPGYKRKYVFCVNTSGFLELILYWTTFSQFFCNLEVFWLSLMTLISTHYRKISVHQPWNVSGSLSPSPLKLTPYKRFITFISNTAAHTRYQSSSGKQNSSVSVYPLTSYPAICTRQLFPWKNALPLSLFGFYSLFIFSHRFWRSPVSLRPWTHSFLHSLPHKYFLPEIHLFPFPQKFISLFISFGLFTV